VVSMIRGGYFRDSMEVVAVFLSLRARKIWSLDGDAVFCHFFVI